MYFCSSQYKIGTMQTVEGSRAVSRGLGASVFVPVPPEWLYEAVLDVRSFPRWASGVRRVEVLEGSDEPGMVSEWEISALGLRKRILSVLEEAEAPALLSWTYESRGGRVRGHGECVIRECGDGALAEFRTEFSSTEPAIEKLIRTSFARNAVSIHLKRCLAQLGRAVSEDDARVRVGPAEVLG
jgi:ribosome-associated toxin RatA of RatAB toxin-antitoxin module